MKAVLAHARLLFDVVSMKIFVWMLGHDGELLDSHLFFFDRYSDLADYHRQQGRITKADRLAPMAEAYFQAARTTNRRSPPPWRCQCHGPEQAPTPTPP